MTADDWTRTYYGAKTHKLVWEPLLISKFGPHYKEANMAWLWARLHVRSFKLGYFTGGFETFINRLTEAVTQRGAELHLNTPVDSVQTMDDGQLAIGFQGETIGFDRVLHTTSPALLAKLAPQLPPSYTQKLTALKHMGAVVLTLALKQPFLTDGTYWLNVPANTPDKMDTDTPFVGLFEHTNYVDAQHYGGDHILYCGDYITPDHPYMSMSKTEIEDRFTSALTKFNPNFRKEWVRKSWLHKASYAQPIPTVDHSQNILPMQTPLSGLYMANMSQVYPWDRGTNFAVEIGRRAARVLLGETE